MKYISDLEARLEAVAVDTKVDSLRAELAARNAEIDHLEKTLNTTASQNNDRYLSILCLSYTECPPKKRNAQFSLQVLILENITCLISSDKTLSSEKNDIKIIEIG